MSDFRNSTYERSTTLSKHIWKLKGMNAPYDISWEILSRARVFNPVTRSCQLCLREKYLIMFQPESATLNSRDELFSTCRHRLKMLLGKTKNWNQLYFLFGSETFTYFFVSFIVTCIAEECGTLSIRNKFVQYMVKKWLHLLLYHAPYCL